MTLTVEEVQYCNRFRKLFPSELQEWAETEAVGECEAFRILDGKPMTQWDVDDTMAALVEYDREWGLRTLYADLRKRDDLPLRFVTGDQ